VSISTHLSIRTLRQFSKGMSHDSGGEGFRLQVSGSSKRKYLKPETLPCRRLTLSAKRLRQMVALGPALVHGEPSY
jgi:hypothetical protein